MFGGARPGFAEAAEWVPIIPLALVGAGAYAVYRAFAENRPHKSNARNGWRNEAFAAKDAQTNRGRKTPTGKDKT